MNQIGIRREDKNPWERRSPLTPAQAARLIREHQIRILVQPSSQRVFPDAAYRDAGAVVREDLSPCSVILGVKEVPSDIFEQDKSYLFFSHTIKGQPYNMPMLKRMMEKRCQLIDYERIVDEQGRRLVLFGRHAGLAGMIESFHALGRRLSAEGITAEENPFLAIRQPFQYENLEEAKAHLKEEVAGRIRTGGLPPSVFPLVVGFLGYGNVSRGAQEIVDCLPCTELEPKDLIGPGKREFSPQTIYKVVFHEQDTVERIDRSRPFDLNDYYQNPERYRSTFGRFLPHLTVLINAIYWDRRFPVMVGVEELKELFAAEERPALRVIGDITCDIEGSVAVTRKATLPDRPSYVYDTVSDQIEDGFADRRGPVIMAVDILPTEFPVESSEHFGNALLPFLPAIASCDFSADLAELRLPDPIRRAMILFQGRLTDAYRYLEEYLPKSRETCS